VHMIIQKSYLTIILGIQEWCVFYSLYRFITCDLPDNPKLTKFSMLIMFFIKIRLNLFDEDIAFRFDVHSSTVSRNFHRVLDVLAVKTTL